MISVSGAFSVTFSVVFAYVADVTDERERSTAYGLVSACRRGNMTSPSGLGLVSGVLPPGTAVPPPP